MSIITLSLLLVGILFFLLIIGLPLAWSLGGTAMVVCLVAFDGNIGIITMQVSRIFDMAQSYSLMAVPLFVMMASLLQRSGVAEQLFRAAYVWAGGLRGGLALGTMFANLIMATMVGVVGAEIVTLGMIALPEMLKNKYDDRLALGTLAAGGGLATLIPPSVVFIVYGMTASCSVSDLFIAGIMPGILLFFLFTGYVIYHCWRHPESAPLPPDEMRNMTIKQKFAEMKGLVVPLIITFGVLGSIYAGVATPTEAAGVGVLLVLVASILNGSFNRKMWWESCVETLKVSCMLTWLFFGAQTIIGAYTLAGGTAFVNEFMNNLGLGRWGTIILINLIWIFLGTFLDWIGVLFLTVPIFLPVILGLGFDPVWFGVLYCMNMHISYLSPPFAPSSFYIKSIAPPEISMTRIYVATMPFLALTVIAQIIVTFWIDLSLWLPNMMR